MTYSHLLWLTTSAGSNDLPSNLQIQIAVVFCWKSLGLDYKLLIGKGAEIEPRNHSQFGHQITCFANFILLLEISQFAQQMTFF